MELLTIREAAQLAGCTAASIDREVKSGSLKVYRYLRRSGLRRDEIRVWSYSRTETLKVAAAFERLSMIWAQTTALMAIELTIAQSQETSFHRQAKKMRELIRVFWHNFNKETEDKFIYAEAIYFPQRKNKGLILPEDHGFENRLEIRGLYSIYRFIISGWNYFLDCMYNRGVIDKDELDRWKRGIEINLDSFSRFLYRATISETLLSKIDIYDS